MKKILKMLHALAMAALVLAPAAASAEKITKHKDKEGYEEWYWEKTVKVKRGEAHTFWIKDLTPTTEISGMDVFCDYTYKDEGEEYEDSVSASEWTEVENSKGGLDKYVLLTAEDWEWVHESKSSLTFKVRVDGWGEDAATEDISFTYGDSAGSGDYPVDPEDPEPVVVTPKGAAENPVTFSITDKNTVQDPGSVEWTKPSGWDESEMVDGNVYLNTPSLVAGRKYVFGFDGIDEYATVTMTLKTGGENLFTEETASTLIAECEGACWSVVVPASGVYEIVVDDDSADFDCWFGSDAWDPKDDTMSGATKLTPSSKGVTVVRTLWADDAADWFSFSATAGTYYKFAFAEKSGTPEVRVYDDDLEECEYALQTDPTMAVMIAAATKGTYYAKVARTAGAKKTDDPYALVATSANPGVVKLAKTAVTVKDSAGYVDLSVSRTGSEGATRITYTTLGEQSSAKDALYYPTTGTIEWANGDKGAKTIRVKIVPQNYGQGGTFQVKIAPVDPESAEFDPENEFPAVIDSKTGDTATVTVTATAKAAPGTIQLADCATPKKPVVDVTATNGYLTLKFERVGGSDGMVSVKIETVDKTAKNGIDYGKTTEEFTWVDGDASAYDFMIPLLSSPDNTATKTFTVKLTANNGKAYARPALASSTITVNIANDRFATTVAAYAKALPKTSGIAIKESKAGTWFVGNDGSVYSSATSGTLTFTLTGPGVFKYELEGEEEVRFVVPYGEKKNNKVEIDASDRLLWYTWEPIPENLETLHQCVKYVRETEGEKVAAGKLPDGLKLAQDKATKKWSISGTPTKAGYFYVKLTKKVGKDMIDVEEINYNVIAAGTAIGTFSGIVETQDTDDALRSLASVTLTAAATGKLSAKVLLGTKTYTFTDTGYASFEEDDDGTTTFRAELPLVQKIGSGKTAETVTNWLTCAIVDAPETDGETRDVETPCEIAFAKLPETKGSGATDDVWYEGTLCRDNAKVTDWVTEAAAFAGYYTASLVNDGASDGEPKGNGYLTLTFDAKGKVKISGMLADGTTYSATSISACLVERGGQAAVRVPLYACKGTSVFGGWLELLANEQTGTLVVSSDARLVWANDAETATRGGEEGFKLEIVPVGGWYDTVTNLQKWFIEYDFSVDLPTWNDDFESLLPSGYESYAFVANPCGQAVDVYGDTVSVVKQSLVKDAVTRFNDFEASVNPSNVKFTFKRATGILNGTFDLWYEGYNEKTKKTEQKSLTGLKHNGVLLLSRGDEGYLDDEVWTSGFYLVPQTLTETDAKGKKVTRKWTGSYRFDVKAAGGARDWSETSSAQ